MFFNSPSKNVVLTSKWRRSYPLVVAMAIRKWIVSIRATRENIPWKSTLGCCTLSITTNLALYLLIVSSTFCFSLNHHLRPTGFTLVDFSTSFSVLLLFVKSIYAFVTFTHSDCLFASSTITSFIIGFQ